MDTIFIISIYKHILKRLVAFVVLLCFLLLNVRPLAAGGWPQPPSVTILDSSRPFTPFLLKGVTIDPRNPLHFDFIFDPGQSSMSTNHSEKEASRIVKYFLAALALPEKDRWVNLSLQESGRIIPEIFGLTDMGRDMLSLDFVLKQLSASLTHPEQKLGAEFWRRVYAKVKKEYGTDEVPVDSVTRVWIVPAQAVVYTSGQSAFVAKSSLKVLAEEDYLAGKPQGLKASEPDSLKGKNTAAVFTDIFRAIVIPEIEKEVNTGDAFAPLRQIYNALVLATWFKQQCKAGTLGKGYFGQKKIKGIDVAKDRFKEKIYEQYTESLKKGVYNFIREYNDPLTEETVSRQYYSGGIEFTTEVDRKVQFLPLEKEVFLAVLRKSSPVLEGASIYIDPITKEEKLPRPRMSSPVKPPVLDDSSRQALEDLGLSYKEFQRLTFAQTGFEEALFNAFPALKLNIFSLRTQERFSRAVRSLTRELRENSVEPKIALGFAIRFAIQQFYQDILPENLSSADNQRWNQIVSQYFRDFLPSPGPRIPEYVKRKYNFDDNMNGRVARALISRTPVVFKAAKNSDGLLTDELRRQAGEGNIDLSVVWGHPSTDERQLIGGRVPKEGKDGLVFGYGVLTEKIEAARSDPGKKYVVLIKNIEAVDPEVRLLLQEMLRISELSHPGLGQVYLPENFQIIFTMAETANIEDDSFYDRVSVKTVPADLTFKPKTLPGVTAGVTAENYRSVLTIKGSADNPVLVLPGTQIRLNQEFRGITTENMFSMIYEKTGLLLDFDTVRMLVAMANAVKSGEPILRLIGPTGVGKTFTSRGFALLRGSSFFANPVSPGTEFTDLIGSFEQQDNHLFAFNGETTFKERLENGGVVALSELNTLVDNNQKASLAWWLTQISQTTPDADGYRTIYLTEVPVAPGQPRPSIRIHPQSLIVVDVNPAVYESRAAFPDVFEESTPELTIGSYISAIAADRAADIHKLSQTARQFLSLGVRIQGRMIPGISDPARLEVLAEAIGTRYYEVVAAYDQHKFGGKDQFHFSNRELKRIAEDVLLWMERGLSSDAALAKAFTHHLVVRWNAQNDRDYAANLIPDAEVTLGLREFVEHEVFVANRRAHIRVASGIDTQVLIDEIKDGRDDVVVRIINVTQELDRFKLEGGRVVNEDGRGYAFAEGLIGRMIAQAETAPDKKFLYVFENIHNLWPEDAVGLNEILQEGTLSVRGRDTKRSIPVNAGIMSISRQDTDWTWSEAEKSRYVTYVYERDTIGEQIQNRLNDYFRANGLEPAVAIALSRMFWRRLKVSIEYIQSNKAYQNRVSERSALKCIELFIKLTAERQEAGGLNVADLINLFRKSCDLTFGISVPRRVLLDNSQSRVAAVYQNLFTVFGALPFGAPLNAVTSQKSGGAETAAGEAEAGNVNLNGEIALALAAAKLDLEMADAEDRSSALQKLKEVLELSEHTGDLTGEPTAAQDLKNLDVVRAVLKQSSHKFRGSVTGFDVNEHGVVVWTNLDEIWIQKNDGKILTTRFPGMIRNVRISADELVYISGENTVCVIKQDDLNHLISYPTYLTTDNVEAIQHLVISNGVVAAATAKGGLLLWEKEGNQWLEKIRWKDGFPIEQLLLSGETLAVRMRNGTCRIWQKNGGAWEQQSGLVLGHSSDNRFKNRIWQIVAKVRRIFLGGDKGYIPGVSQIALSETEFAIFTHSGEIIMWAKEVGQWRAEPVLRTSIEPGVYRVGHFVLKDSALVYCSFNGEVRLWGKHGDKWIKEPLIKDDTFGTNVRFFDFNNGVLAIGGNVGALKTSSAEPKGGIRVWEREFSLWGPKWQLRIKEDNLDGLADLKVSKGAVRVLAVTLNGQILSWVNQIIKWQIDPVRTIKHSGQIFGAQTHSGNLLVVTTDAVDVYQPGIGIVYGTAVMQFNGAEDVPVSDLADEVVRMSVREPPRPEILAQQEARAKQEIILGDEKKRAPALLKLGETLTAAEQADHLEKEAEVESATLADLDVVVGLMSESGHKFAGKIKGFESNEYGVLAWSDQKEIWLKDAKGDIIEYQFDQEIRYARIARDRLVVADIDRIYIWEKDNGVWQRRAFVSDLLPGYTKGLAISDDGVVAVCNSYGQIYLFKKQNGQWKSANNIKVFFVIGMIFDRLEKFLLKTNVGMVLCRFIEKWDFRMRSNRSFDKIYFRGELLVVEEVVDYDGKQYFGVFERKDGRWARVFKRKFDGPIKNFVVLKNVLTVVDKQGVVFSVSKSEGKWVMRERRIGSEQVLYISEDVWLSAIGEVQLVYKDGDQPEQYLFLPVRFAEVSYVARDKDFLAIGTKSGSIYLYEKKDYLPIGNTSRMSAYLEPQNKWRLAGQADNLGTIKGLNIKDGKVIVATEDGSVKWFGVGRGMVHEGIVRNLNGEGQMDQRSLSKKVTRLKVKYERHNQTGSPEDQKFEPLVGYGNRPFYFGADRDGNVYLNFDNRWYRTRHTLTQPFDHALLSGPRTAPVNGRPTEIFPVRLDAVKHPDSRLERSFTKKDFLMTTGDLTEEEKAVLLNFEISRQVDLEGPSGAGKTSIGKEIALLLGLPVFVLQMHGQRDLSDLIGAYREDEHGRYYLSMKPKPVAKDILEAAVAPALVSRLLEKGVIRVDDKDPEVYYWGYGIYSLVDLEERLDALGGILGQPDKKALRALVHYRLPLLEFLTWGGIYIVDEGAIGEQGQALINWFSRIVNGDSEISIDDFTGLSIRFKVHTDFHLIITNNSPEDTAGREFLKSEIAANIGFIYVPEDDSPDTIEGLLEHFLQDELAGTDVRGVKSALRKLYLDIKAAVGTSIGTDKKERYYISKREIRRVAARLLFEYKKDPEHFDFTYSFYKALRIVFEAAFSHEQERQFVMDKIVTHLKETFPERAQAIDQFKAKLEAEINNRFAFASTENEKWVLWVADELLNQDEPLLLIDERGARTRAMLRRLQENRGAVFDLVDAVPSHTSFELLGAILPEFSDKGIAKPGSRMRFVKGRLIEHLLTKEEMEQAESQGGKSQEVIVWIRNIDQWNEDIRSSLNGLLENGYIDIETSRGETIRYYKPRHVRFIAGINAQSGEDFSSAFFNRWVKVGVLAEPRPDQNVDKGESDFQKVLSDVYEMDSREAYLFARLFLETSRREAQRQWSVQESYDLTPETFYLIAAAVRLAKQQSPQWQAILAAFERQNYDPRRESPTNAAQRDLEAEYRRLSNRILTQEIARLFLPRFRTATSADTGDRKLVEDSIRAVFNLQGPITLDTTDIVSPDLSAVPDKIRLYYTTKIREYLSALQRASQMNRGIDMLGESGAAKTTLAEHLAHRTGRKFYKYQSHAKSEVTDLTIELSQTEDGVIQKRYKEFYAWLKNGNAVIDFDEANAAPHILWALEAVLNGESVIYPAFPGEKPFKIGDNITIVFTRNPLRYAGRQQIEKRITDKMVVLWIDLPDPEEKAKIVQTFYGVWALEEETAVAPTEELHPKEKANIPHESDLPVSDTIDMDTDMKEGREIPTMQDEKNLTEPPAVSTAPKPAARGVFTPELYPRTRLGVYNRFDAATEKFWLERGEYKSVPVTPKTGRERTIIEETRDIFQGQYILRLGHAFSRLPSAGADMEFIDLSVRDTAGNLLDIPVEITRDSADNYYIRQKDADAPAAEVEIRYTVTVAKEYFGKIIPNNPDIGPDIRETMTVMGLTPNNPDIGPDIREAMTVMGLTGKERDFREVLYKMIAFTRDFKLEKITAEGPSKFLRILRSGAGVCRHGAQIFAATAWAIGMPARLVVSDIHEFVEVEVPGIGWMQIDLGGGGDPANMDLSPLANERHNPAYANDFPEPENYKQKKELYRDLYEKAMKDQGIKPPVSPRPNRSGETGAADNDAAIGGHFDPKLEGERIDAALANLIREQGATLNQDIENSFQSGTVIAEQVFERMKRAIEAGIRYKREMKKNGLEIDPVAWMLRLPNPFVKRTRVTKLQTTAVAVLFDASGSISVIREPVTYAIAVTGKNFQQLNDTAPQHFHYDLSTYTHLEPETIDSMSQRMSAEDMDKQLIKLANLIGNGGGNDLQRAMSFKLTNEQGTGFLDAREARTAKVKYMIVFTDGADAAIRQNGNDYEPQDSFKEVLRRYRDAGIDLIAIGIGAGSKYVRAFKGEGQHFVQIDDKHPENIAEAIAAIAELKSRGMGILPDGDITPLMQFSQSSPISDADANKVGGIDLTADWVTIETHTAGREIQIPRLPENFDWSRVQGLNPLILEFYSY
ncbi:MAG: AAA family ATPase [Candidatus Omnitrophica bacterium]|nr:AAA family ATPase [Candidatus Omnitrophota bacterium]